MFGPSGQALSVGRVLGIPISLHWSLFALGLAYLLRDLSLYSATGAFVALLVSLLGTASVLIHELAHAFTGSRFGYRTRAIELHAFGGVAEIVGGPSSSAESSRHEIFISLAGPLANFALYVAFSALAAASAGHVYASAVLFTAARLNLVLTAINLLPCFPFDGGRALVGALRLRMGPVRGDRVAYTVGLALAAPGFILAIVFSQPILALFFYMAFDTCRQHRAALDASFGGARVVHAVTGGGPTLWDRLRSLVTPSREPRPPKLRVIKGGRFEEPPDRTARG